MEKQKNLTILLLLVLIGFLLYFLFQKKDTEIIRTRIKMEIPIPEIRHEFEPVLMPVPKKEKSRPEPIYEYEKADRKKKDSLYKEAVKEREYDTIYSDDIQDITVRSLVQGKLLEQSVGYRIKERTLPVDTLFDLPVKKRLQFYLGGGLTMPVWNKDHSAPAPVGYLMIKNKKDNILLGGVDTFGNLHIGYSFKL